MRGKRRTQRKILRALLWLSLTGLLRSLGPVACLRGVDPPTTAFILGYRLEGLLRGDWHSVDQLWRPRSQISPHLALAVVASEDQRFPHHRGFDLASIFDALADHQRGERLRGASTLSQQTAKNLFLWPGRSFLRKGLEAYFTTLIEGLWDKGRILEVYLNVAEFGPGIYGAEAAAQHFFQRPATRLTRHQAALLAASLPNPKYRDPSRPSRYLRQRAALIERHMGRLGGGYLSF